MPRKSEPRDIRSMARAYSDGNIKALAALAAEGNEPEIRLRAIGMLLERGWGRPQQELKTDSEIRVTIRKMLGDD
jgi:hypothetical protein